MNKKKVIIIGGGIGGLATAALLGKEGYSVTLLEKNNNIGGRASIWKEKGFTFDLGPSWYLMPEVFEKYFKLFKKKPSDFFKLIHLNPHYRVFFSGNEWLDIQKDLNKNLAMFEEMEPGSRKKIKEFLKVAEKNYSLAMKYILYNNYSSFRDFLNKDLANAGKNMRLFQKLDQFTNQYTKNTRIKQILEYSIVFLGGSPKNIPAFYSIITHIDFSLGVFYPKGGIYSVIQALESLCKTHGVTIVKNSEVKKIIVENGKATSVKTAKKTYSADIIVSNADYPHTELHLLDEKYQTYKEKYWKKKTYAPSAFLLYLGVKGKIKNLTHHNLFFANNWEEHFDQIFTNPKWPEKPSYYVCCPSKTDPVAAPKGMENLFILVPVPPGLSDIDKIRQSYAKKVISHLEELVNEKFEDRIVVKRIFSQRDFTKEYNAYKGTALGLAHTLFQTALFRPAIKSKKVKNLFYVGQYTQPGIGMPMCIISSEIVVKEIKKYG